MPETESSPEEPVRLKVADPHAKPKLRKRVYETVAVVDLDGGFGIALDGRALNTPGKSPLITPSRPLAEAVAQEWNAQKENIDPATMPLSKLLNTAIDRVSPLRTEVIADLLSFIDADALCYRAETPQPLVDRQHVVWQPVLDWLAATHGITLSVAAGIMPHSQSPETAEAIERVLTAYDDTTLTASQATASLTSSLALGIALADQHLSGEEVFAASQLEETWQIEQWGEDAEALKRRTILKSDINAVEQFVALTR